MVANYDKTPFITVKGQDDNCHEGWEAVGQVIGGAAAASGKSSSRLDSRAKKVVAIECYPGVQDEEVIPQLTAALPGTFFFTRDAMLSEGMILQLVYPDVTDDEIFGYITRLELVDFFDSAKRRAMQKAVDQTGGIVYVYGPGATLIAEEWDLLVYFDMPRWEAQLRFRRNEAANLGLTNKT
ncbi:MAG TPA: hypothetical protein VK518_00060, partial [Puia sp.]|nr:hypothetical protein [Puia sp.]